MKGRKAFEKIPSIGNEKHVTLEKIQKNRQKEDYYSSNEPYKINFSCFGSGFLVCLHQCYLIRKIGFFHNKTELGEATFLVSVFLKYGIVSLKSSYHSAACGEKIICYNNDIRKTDISDNQNHVFFRI